MNDENVKNELTKAAEILNMELSAIEEKWNEIKSTRFYSSFFLPGFLAGFLKTSIVEITSKNGTILKIPFYTKKKQIPNI